MLVALLDIPADVLKNSADLVFLVQCEICSEMFFAGRLR